MQPIRLVSIAIRLEARPLLLIRYLLLLDVFAGFSILCPKLSVNDHPWTRGPPSQIDQPARTTRSPRGMPRSICTEPGVPSSPMPVYILGPCTSAPDPFVFSSFRQNTRHLAVLSFLGGKMGKDRTPMGNKHLFRKSHEAKNNCTHEALEWSPRTSPKNV